jgi:hypothetical protein
MTTYFSVTELHLTLGLPSGCFLRNVLIEILYAFLVSLDQLLAQTTVADLELLGEQQIMKFLAV